MRKIAGSVNPADLFTHHSLTRERLIALTALFEAEFRGGRAASAPKTRATTGVRPTMAEVMALSQCNAEEEMGELTDMPIMPHRVYSAEELDEIYPSLEAVEAMDDEELEHDDLLEHGLQIAEGIARDASIFGRKRVHKG